MWVLVRFQGCIVQPHKTETQRQTQRRTGSEALTHIHINLHVHAYYTNTHIQRGGRTHTHTHSQATHTQSHPALKSVKTGGSWKTAHPFLLLIYSPSPACKVQTEKNKRGKGTAVRLWETKQRRKLDTHGGCRCVCVDWWCECLLRQIQFEFQYVDSIFRTGKIILMELRFDDSKRIAFISYSDLMQFGSFYNSICSALTDTPTLPPICVTLMCFRKRSGGGSCI